MIYKPIQNERQCLVLYLHPDCDPSSCFIFFTRDLVLLVKIYCYFVCVHLQYTVGL